MKLGEIKIEALLMIFPTESILIDSEDDEAIISALLELRENPNYAPYLAAMPGAINRCFASLESKGLVPSREFNLDKTKCEKIGNKYRVNLKNIIKDFGYIERVIKYTDSHYKGVVGFDKEGEDVILLDNLKDEYRIIYQPIMKRIKQTTSDAETIELSEDILSIIPYFLIEKTFALDALSNIFSYSIVKFPIYSQ